MPAAFRGCARRWFSGAAAPVGSLGRGGRERSRAAGGAGLPGGGGAHLGASGALGEGAGSQAPA